MSFSGSGQMYAGVPTRLRIPSIGVDSVIEKTGLTSTGAMGVPNIVGDVAWFQLGQRPGESGTAVIDGHFGLLKNGDHSVFDTLYEVKVGDKVYVEDNTGGVKTFVVREVKTLDPQADATDVFGTNTGPSHLNLITCEGVWDKTTKSYSQRLVVFTDRE